MLTERPIETLERRFHMSQRSYPPREWALALTAEDFTGLDARCADIEAVLVATGPSDNAHGLDVGIPSTAGPAMGVRHRLAEAGALPADIADGSHT
jgi:uracil-DNA glycosylase